MLESELELTHFLSHECLTSIFAFNNSLTTKIKELDKTRDVKLNSN